MSANLKPSENRRKRSDLSPFFEPDVVAVFGSIKDSAGAGYGVVRNMLEFGFRGKIYPINPSCDEVFGLKAYPDLDKVAESIDLAMVIIPPPAVPEVIEQCARRGIKSVIIGTEGFAEAGEAGAELQKQVVDIAHRRGIRIIGPNTIGILNSGNGLITNPYFIGYDNVPKGSIAYSSQSGFLSNAAHHLGDSAYPISKMCDFGNKCDIDEVEFLDFVMDDPETKVISMHVEGVRDGRAFLEACREAVKKKPVLALKAGNSEAGIRAASSHTGSLAMDDQVYACALKQAGVIRVDDWEEYWEIPRVFSSQTLPRGKRIAIVTMTGGAGVLATDAAVSAGLEIASFTSLTVDRLERLNQRLAKNPIDLGPTMVVMESPFSILDEVLTPVLIDANVDCAVIVINGYMFEENPSAIDRLHQVVQHAAKPVTIFIYGTRMCWLEEASRKLASFGLAVYRNLNTAVKALGVAAQYSDSLGE
ncbi:acetate--CoA ligase family protein [Chloroflexota bacterium]